MLRTGRPYQNNSEDEKPIARSAGGAPRPLEPAPLQQAGVLDAQIMESIRALISEQLQALREELRQPAPAPRSPGVFSSPEVQRQTAPDHVPPTISLSDYLGRSPELNHFAGLTPQLNLQAPPAFGKRLHHLRDVYTYWSFLNDYKGYKIQNPHVAQTMRIVQFIPQEILFGQLDLQQEIENQAGSLLNDEIVHDRIATHFSAIVSTPRQFLNTMESIRPPAAAFDTHATDVMEATLPLLQYLQKLQHFYGLCAYMCPAAVPREDDYDRTTRTTVKFIANRALADWWPWWKTDIWPQASKLRERSWSKVNAHIDAAVRTLVARFNTVQPLMESWRAFDGKATHRPQGERDEYANRDARRLLVRTNDSPQRNSNWNPPAAKSANDVRKSEYRPYRAESHATGSATPSPDRSSFHQRPAPHPHRVHLMEDAMPDLDDDIFLHAQDEPKPTDTSDPNDTLELDITPDELAAVDSTAGARICFRAMNEGVCPHGASCKFLHAKPLYVEYAKELLRKYGPS